jgi:hypothetical protein
VKSLKLTPFIEIKRELLSCLNLTKEYVYDSSSPWLPYCFSHSQLTNKQYLVLKQLLSQMQTNLSKSPAKIRKSPVIELLFFSP